jgi:hypothetical protein
VTARAIVIAFLLLVGLSVAAFYVSVVWSTVSFTSSVPPIAQLDLLVLLAAAMAVPIFRRSGLTRRELLTIYSILLVAAPIVSGGILYWMIPKTIVDYYLARANPAWESTFLPHIPWWYSPSDPAAVEDFFVGKATVPWSLWLTPMAAWLSLAAAIFVAVSCLLSLLRGQWVRNERLTYPMAQIPLEVVAEGFAGEKGAGRLAAGTALWLGVGISLVVNFLSSLSARVPALPQLPLGPILIIPWQKVGPLAGLGEFYVVLWPWLIALAYLLPKELSFSCWFFWIVRLALTVASVAAGHTPQLPEEWFGDPSFPAPYFQGTGAVLALGIWGLWTARRHLGRALRMALAGGHRGADADEPMSYRLALIGFVVATAWMVGFYWVAGCRLTFALVLVALTLSYYMIWARLRAETGLGFLAFPQDLQDVMRTTFGGAMYTPREQITISSARWSYSSGEGISFDTTTANLSDVFRIADAAGISQRRLMAATFGALVVSLVLGTYIVLTGTYHYGYFGTATGAANYFPSLQTRHDAGSVYASLVSPEPMQIGGVIGILAGAAAAVVLGVLRLRFWWWPFHPIGYLAANCWGWSWYSMPFVLGWLAKVLVIRYGGLRLYRQAVPVAVGLIVGDMLNRGVWALIALATHGRVP